jgi:hypothetical protein
MSKSNQEKVYVALVRGDSVIARELVNVPINREVQGAITLTAALIDQMLMKNPQYGADLEVTVLTDCE